MVSCLKLFKMYSPRVFFKGRMMLYVFESLKWKQKINLKTQIENAWMLDFHGVKIAVTHVSRHFGVYSRKQKKRFRENCFENMVTFRKKVQILRKVKTKNHESFHNLWRILWTKLVLLVEFWDHIFQQFCLKKKCFLLYTPKCLKPCVNGITKCVTARIYPIKVWILETIFS